MMTKEELKKLEATLWSSADTLRANSDLKSTEYSTPVLGLIFLRFADNKYSSHEKQIMDEYKKLKGTRREKPVSDIAIEKCGFYLPDTARYEYLLNLPEKEDIAKALKAAMVFIEEYKPELKGILPQDEYFRLVRKPEYRVIPKQLLKNFADIPRDATGDMFGQIYEYFLGKFALAEGQGVDDVNLRRVENDKRFNTYGIPRRKSKGKVKDRGAETVPNANYLWINLFATSLKPGGRAALVMANSASDARHSEADIRKTLIEKNLIYGMLTLPSNMFYTVTLPATLWFFDKNKQDDKILFIDARNIFTQVDRAHREFSEEQIQNIAVISRLHKGDRKEFINLIHWYFKQGMDRLKDHRDLLKSVARKVIAFLKQHDGKDVPDFDSVLEKSRDLEKAYQSYAKIYDPGNIEKTNKVQHALHDAVTPFFLTIHQLLKSVDKKVRKIEKEKSLGKDIKGLKTELHQLHTEVKDTEYFFSHITWLHERFPCAAYEDVTGLCKLAGPDEIKEQDYSLNPGRYVGVVIEEDGKTEEEFIEEIISLNEELNQLNKEAKKLEKVINRNVSQITGE